MVLAVCDRALKVFQSAPPTEVRGDWPGFLAKPLSGLFQSAPPTEVRGDAPVPVKCSAYVGVSIRSPHRSEGRSPAVYTTAPSA